MKKSFITLMLFMGFIGCLLSSCNKKQAIKQKEDDRHGLTVVAENDSIEILQRIEKAAKPNSFELDSTSVWVRNKATDSIRYIFSTKLCSDYGETDLDCIPAMFSPEFVYGSRSLLVFASTCDFRNYYTKLYDIQTNTLKNMAGDYKGQTNVIGYFITNMYGYYDDGDGGRYDRIRIYDHECNLLKEFEVKEPERE